MCKPWRTIVNIYWEHHNPVEFSNPHRHLLLMNRLFNRGATAPFGSRIIQEISKRFPDQGLRNDKTQFL